MFPAGAKKPLEIAVKRKAFRTASGAVREVLRDFSMTIGAGKVYALVGPSGCGKTTLLRIIIGLDRDFEGSIKMPAQPRIGMVFQEPRLLPWRSVLQNLRLAAPQASDDDLVRIAGDLGLGEHLTHFPGELSLGLARRVALARAFAVKPDLLVLDEPFVSLDTVLAERLRNELAALVERTRVTTLLVTHGIEEAIRLADHIFLLAGQPTGIVAELDITHPRQAMTDDYAAQTKIEIGAILARAAAG
ncbi:ABC transporter ATP-binding protein [Methylovirgula sp. HY1]|uniref:ABC transporter ATP-binding protein n=1 Tax=Methylovirgula sp. HY1 TaxID=2822761 RepID=UPI001C5B0A3F|nr:ATP-binding cassette domain-containing protein [Methylovirgula sp. HY1]QXX75955.1 Aliphatic sulfonates import ATP-binding protein SsuB [Methylovirgula sp. HY1]